MDFYQGVVADYLRADRKLFINTEYCIQIEPGPNPDNSGKHWYCDMLALEIGARRVYLCEVTFSKSAGALLKRLSEWAEYWPRVTKAIARDSDLDDNWNYITWIFVPEISLDTVLNWLTVRDNLPFNTRITTLEMVQPWKYQSWNRMGEAVKPVQIPTHFH